MKYWYVGAGVRLIRSLKVPPSVQFTPNTSGATVRVSHRMRHAIEYATRHRSHSTVGNVRGVHAIQSAADRQWGTSHGT